MIIEKLKKMLAKKEERKKELKNRAEKCEEIEELRSINSEVDKLNGEIAELRGLIEDLEKAGDEEEETRQAGPTGEVEILATYGVGNGEEGKDERSKEIEEAEKRGKALKEKRAVTVGSSDVILPKHQATDIKGTFNEVSSIVDRVNIKPLNGGESFEQPYMIGYGTGGYTEEGGDPTEAEPEWSYAIINKTKITAYAEDTEELQKLPAADYDAEVMKGIRIAIRKKLAAEILIGDGEPGHFVGIFNANATAIDPNTDKEIAAIDEKTLDEIIYSFGGDENVEDEAVLILNKADVKAFATLRKQNGDKVYDVKHNGNTGTIDGVPYIINSKCKAISDPNTTAGEYCMAYGPLSNYTMAIFSDMEVRRSDDYKFKEGMIAHRGVVFAGGNVTAHNGFLRIKKASEA